MKHMRISGYFLKPGLILLWGYIPGSVGLLRHSTTWQPRPSKCVTSLSSSSSSSPSSLSSTSSSSPGVRDTCETSQRRHSQLCHTHTLLTLHRQTGPESVTSSLRLHLLYLPARQRHHHRRHPIKKRGFLLSPHRCRPPRPPRGASWPWCAWPGSPRPSTCRDWRLSPTARTRTRTGNVRY